MWALILAKENGPVTADHHSKLSAKEHMDLVDRHIRYAIDTDDRIQ